MNFIATPGYALARETCSNEWKLWRVTFHRKKKKIIHYIDKHVANRVQYN